MYKDTSNVAILVKQEEGVSNLASRHYWMVSYNDNILSNVDVGVDDSRVDDGPFADENVITDLQREKCNTEKKTIFEN